MKSYENSSCFYNDVINFIDLNDHDGAIKYIKNNICTLKKPDDIALAYLNCGFLNNKLGDYMAAINDFSKSIVIEAELDIINERSKDISYSGRSNSKYKNGDYKGAIEDKMKAKKIRLLEDSESSEYNFSKIDYNNILLGTFEKKELEPKYITLIKVSKFETSRYDLIDDYKKLISKTRRDEVIKKLELLSDSKYKIGDYKASIKAIRRAEKFY